MDGLPIPVWGYGGKQIIDWARVSEEDYRSLKQHRWWIADGYAYRTAYVDGRKTSISMHREVMGVWFFDGTEIDHLNWNRLDNRRENLRIVTRYENEQNKDNSYKSSQYKGVTLDKSGRWKAQAHKPGYGNVYIGLFNTEEEARRAREKYDQEVSRLNH